MASLKGTFTHPLSSKLLQPAHSRSCVPWSPQVPLNWSQSPECQPWALFACGESSVPWNLEGRVCPRRYALCSWQRQLGLFLLWEPAWGPLPGNWLWESHNTVIFMLFEYSMALYSGWCLSNSELLGYSGCFLKHLGLRQVGQISFLEWNRRLQLLEASVRIWTEPWLSLTLSPPHPLTFPFLFSLSAFLDCWHGQGGETFWLLSWSLGAPKWEWIYVCARERESMWSSNRWRERCVVCVHAQVCVGVIRRMCAYVLHVGVCGNRTHFSPTRSYLLPSENSGGGEVTQESLAHPCQVWTVSEKRPRATGNPRWSYGCFDSLLFCFYIIISYEIIPRC